MLQQPAPRDCWFWHTNLWGAQDVTPPSEHACIAYARQKQQAQFCSGFHRTHPVLIRQTSALMSATSGGSPPLLRGQTEQVLGQPSVQAGEHQLTEWEAQDAMLA